MVVLNILAQSRGSGTPTYDLIEGTITVSGGDGLKYTSLNKKVDEFEATRDDPGNIVTNNENFIRITDMVKVYKGDVYHLSKRRARGEKFGIIGDVQSGTPENDTNLPTAFPSGNGIFITMYAYDDAKPDGLGDVVYQSYITQSSGNEYSEHLLDFSNKNYEGKFKVYNSGQTSAILLDDFGKPTTGGKWRLPDELPMVLEVVIRNATLKKFKIPGLDDEHFGTFFRVENDKKMFLNPRSHDGYIPFASHRGVLRKYPENSWPAIVEGLQVPGMDQIEIDMDRTKDGVIVLTHAASTVKRYMNSTSRLKDLTWAQVQQLHPKDRTERIWDGSNGTEELFIESLEQVLPRLKDRVMIHMDKVEKYIDKVLDVSEPLKMTHQLVFKGKASPQKLYNDYVINTAPNNYDGRHGNILEKINFLPVAFSFAKTTKAADLELPADATWEQIFDKWVSYSKGQETNYDLKGCIRGFETQWFNEFLTDDVSLVNSLDHLKQKNLTSLSSPMFVEDYPGIWIPKINQWMRFNTNRDFRYNFDFWYDLNPSDPSENNANSEVEKRTISDTIISNGEYRLMSYLKDRGYRNIPERFK